MSKNVPWVFRKIDECLVNFPDNIRDAVLRNCRLAKIESSTNAFLRFFQSFLQHWSAKMMLEQLRFHYVYRSGVKIYSSYRIENLMIKTPNQKLIFWIWNTQFQTHDLMLCRKNRRPKGKYVAYWKQLDF